MSFTTTSPRHPELDNFRVQDLPVPACTFDRELRFTAVNEGIAEINGFPIEAHLGKTVRELLPNLADEVTRNLTRALRGESFTHTIHGETPRSPGVTRVWITRYFPLTDGAHVFGVGVVTEETTQRNRARAALRKANARLSSQNDLLCVLSSAIAHDLKTPLASAIMRLELAVRAPGLDAGAREHVEEAIGTLHAGSEMITGLLRIASIDTVQSAEIVPLNEVCRSVWDKLSPLAKEAGPAVLEIPAPLPDVMGDDHLIADAIQNLFENAIKHRGAGRPCLVRVTARCTHERVSLTIDDNGTGIPADKREDLRKPFRKSADSSGTGLGLAIVERIIGAHAGAVRIADAPAGGARFVLTLPVADPARIGKPIRKRAPKPQRALADDRR